LEDGTPRTSFLNDDIRRRLDTETISTRPGAELDSRASSQARYAQWRKSQSQSELVEYLIPRLTRRIEREWPAYMARPPGHESLTREELLERVRELGPWRVPFQLRDGVSTIWHSTPQGLQNIDAYLFRRDLITGTAAELLGDELGASSVLDLGCSAGFFSLYMATRGAAHVDGVDIRAASIARARFVAEHYGVENVTFQLSDVDEFVTDRTWDVVLNLGLLYHVVDPLRLLRQTYELCRKFAVIDTICHPEPFAAFILFGDKNTEISTEGRDEWEVHPTYRAAIEGIRYAGFSEVIELVGTGEPPHPFYANGDRRCFVAFR
jgi:2-polyprenyl-3-methyl-5-hydroxy-6-metoxy-1,4-benzoquinol methylase